MWDRHKADSEIEAASGVETETGTTWRSIMIMPSTVRGVGDSSSSGGGGGGSVVRTWRCPSSARGARASCPGEEKHGIQVTPRMTRALVRPAG